MLRITQFVVRLIQLVLGVRKSVIERLDILVLAQDFLTQRLVLRFGFLSASHGVIRLLTELSQSLIARGVRTGSHLSCFDKSTYVLDPIHGSICVADLRNFG